MHVQDGNAARAAGRTRPAALWIAAAAISGALSVIAGAFAAHGLDPQADAARIGWLHTGSLYEALHALAMLLVCGLLGNGQAGREQLDRTLGKAALWLFLVGNIVFPAALYGLALHGPLWLGAVAPIGGAAFILGWLTLAGAALRRGFQP